MWVFARSHFDSGGKVGFGSIWRERGAPALALAWLTLSMQFGGRMQKKRFVETLQANGVCSNACWYLDMSGKLRYFSSYYSLALLMRFVHLLSRFSSNPTTHFSSCTPSHPSRVLPQTAHVDYCFALFSLSLVVWLTFRPRPFESR